MGAVVELSDPEWKRIEHLFDPAGRRGAPARYPRRLMVEAMLFLARTGSPWRYLPDHYPPWPAVWQQWRRWRSSGAWATAMRLIADEIRSKKRSDVQPTMVMIDAQTVKGGRGGITFHNAGGRGGRTVGAKRSILIEILGLPLAVRVDPARPHDVRVGRKLIADHLGELPGVQTIVADRGYGGLKTLAASNGLALDIKRPPRGSKGFVPIMPHVRVEHAFARLGRWRRLARCYEGTVASAQAWLEVACLAYLFTRLRAEPP